MAENNNLQQQKTEPEQKEKPYKVQVKISQKGLKSFYRANFHFTDEWQTVAVTQKQLALIEREVKLSVKKA